MHERSVITLSLLLRAVHIYSGLCAIIVIEKLRAFAYLIFVS
ncbi:hypothetical protein ALT717_20074 [Alteromonas macleodii]